MYEIPPEVESSRMLGFYNLQHGSNVHCIDLDPHSKSAGGAYEDTSLVEKFTLSEEEYNKRKGTLREWGRKQKENDPEFSLRKHAREHAELVEAKRLYRESGIVKAGFEVDESGAVIRSEKIEVVRKEDKVSVAETEFGEGSVEHLKLKERCQVQPGDRRGKIAFIGLIEELGGGGYWVGVILDEPVGKTDGTVKSSGVRYFEAPGASRGGFFRGKNVEMGDFPEIDIMDELEDSEDEL